MSIDLIAEMRTAALAVHQMHLDRLVSLGVSPDTIAAAGEHFYPFGIVRAESTGGGHYQPGNGVPHVVLPVIEDGELIDLVAFRTSAPDEWLMRTGNGWGLGLYDGVGRYMWGVPPHIFATPLDWLRSGCSGICVLDWRSPEIFKLDVFETVTVSDPATRKLLVNAMSRPQRIPNIEIMEVISNAA